MSRAGKVVRALLTFYLALFVVTLVFSSVLMLFGVELWTDLWWTVMILAWNFVLAIAVGMWWNVSELAGKSSEEEIGGFLKSIMDEDEENPFG